MNKNELRKICLEKRLALHEEEVNQRSISISKLFFSSFELTPRLSLHLFLPIKNKKEVNTFYILETLLEKYPHIKIVLPKSDFKTKLMEHILYTPSTKLTENKYGIVEPEEGLIIEEKKIDMVLIPLLAFDNKGNRLGYGMGFYDRFLELCRPECIKIGLSLENHVDNLQVEIHDERMDFCVTPEKVYTFL